MNDAPKLGKQFDVNREQMMTNVDNNQCYMMLARANLFKVPK